MLNRRYAYKIFVATALSATLLLQSGTVFAWGGHSGRSHRGHKSAYLYPRYYVAPIIGGLTYLYCYSLVNRKKDTTYVVMPSVTRTVIVSSDTSKRIAGETVAINIPNSDGTYTQVKLTRSGDGYLGPQGEYYTDHPTVEQLKVLYGER